MADRAPSALRWLIGVELAHLRNRAGLTQTDLAKLTTISKQKLGHLETGERRQYPVDLAEVLAACSAAQHDIDRLTSLAVLADGTTWWGAWTDVVPDWFGTFVGLERLATAEFVFEPITLQGLLQTPEYALEMTQPGRRVRPDHSERVVEVRTERARRLVADDEPLRLHAVVTEQALRLRVGTPENTRQIMRAQYEHLVELAARPNVTLQVMTPECGVHDATTGQFAVLDFDSARSIAYVELQDGAVYAQQAGEVDTYKESARNLGAVALSPADSVDFVAGLIDQL